MTHTEQIRVSGLVQGVGFRPTVWRLAYAYKLTGTVVNDGAGVLIVLQGASSLCDQFVQAIQQQSPPLARIDCIERESLENAVVFADFNIIESSEGSISTGVVHDAATCPDCLAEVQTPSDRRYRYPFTNCTHCGPRLSIVEAIPYDRANTSMAKFVMCADCAAEYTDPANRRFHAQPNACSACGPSVWLEDIKGQCTKSADDDLITHASRLLREGKILAIKGIGGFHLCCDASNQQTVARLRERKRRYQKPLALMARDLGVIEQYAELNTEARQLLSSAAAPVLLLPRLTNSSLASDVAPGHRHMGFMLPYSPLHHLLLQDWDTPLVMTSANPSDEPQCTQNREAVERLRGIADVFLMHDRAIINRVDDSVLRIDNGVPRFLRRARGYAPACIPLPPGFEQAEALIALGGELKNTVCLLQAGQAIVSQHLGDLEDARTLMAFEQTVRLYQKLYAHKPHCIVIDQHPDYLSSKFGMEWAQREEIRLETVQHHHAHIASVMADNGHRLDAGPVLGVALDGLGFGTDGSLWGGEFLHVDYPHAQRLAHLRPVVMPGGLSAIREPWRNTWAQLVATGHWQVFSQTYAELDVFQFLQQQALETLGVMQEKGINSPLASSCGRLFDAVAAALGVCTAKVSYEGQAAIELEALLSTDARQSPAYTFKLDDHDGLVQISSDSMWHALFADLQKGIDRAEISARFHNGLVALICSLVKRLCSEHQLDTVALSGGVFQNAYLISRCEEQLKAQGLHVYSPRQMPANDAGLSLGQAVIVAAQRLRETQT